MSDTLQEGEDARHRHEQIGGEYRCNKCRAEFKTIPDFDKHECKQQREDQTGEHQVNRSGVCQIPGCPCRGWSAQETADVKETTMTTEERIKQIPACVECGAVQFARYGHFPECSQFIADLDKVKFDSEHQPAARGGGEAWSVQVLSREARILAGSGSLEDKTIIADHLSGYVARQIVTEHNQYQALVAERERLLRTLRQVRNAALVWADSRYLETAQIGLRQMASDIDKELATDEQRSTSE